MLLVDKNAVIYGADGSGRVHRTKTRRAPGLRARSEGDPVNRVTSRDGTSIAFERLGGGASRLLWQA